MKQQADLNITLFERERQMVSACVCASVLESMALSSSSFLKKKKNNFKKGRFPLVVRLTVMSFLWRRNSFISGKKVLRSRFGFNREF